MARQTIAVLGASGLIGFGVARDLLQREFDVRALAREFSPMQSAALDDAAVTAPLVSLSEAALAQALDGADIVINCIGVLQGSTDAVHRAFTERLARVCAPFTLLVQVSVPGDAADDHTEFSRSKRAAERLIAKSGAPYVILRPGFVLAPGAYGGSALLRALAALPLRLPPREASAPFAAVALSDISKTVARLVQRWRGGERDFAHAWDLMEASPGNVGSVIEALRAHVGGPAPRFTLPAWLLSLGAKAGDLAAPLGWMPPMRSTAIAELRRGVEGNPKPWMVQTGITPLSIREALIEISPTVQDAWFARLYLLKALAIVGLALFWILSGLIALTVSAAPASAILRHHGFSPDHADVLTMASSMMDIGVGLAIAVHRTSRVGLIAGIALSLFYMASAVMIAPDLWVEPLGALVKTGPAVILMLVCLAIQDKR